MCLFGLCQHLQTCPFLFCQSRLLSKTSRALRNRREIQAPLVPLLASSSGDGATTVWQSREAHRFPLHRVQDKSSKGACLVSSYILNCVSSWADSLNDPEPQASRILAVRTATLWPKRGQDEVRTDLTVIEESGCRSQGAAAIHDTNQLQSAQRTQHRSHALKSSSQSYYPAESSLATSEARFVLQ